MPLASGGGAGEEGGATALGTGEGRPSTMVPREGEYKPTTARASVMDGRRCCGEADVGRAGRWAGGGGELALRNDHNALG